MKVFLEFKGHVLTAEIDRNRVATVAQFIEAIQSQSEALNGKSFLVYCKCELNISNSSKTNLKPFSSWFVNSNNELYSFCFLAGGEEKMLITDVNLKTAIDSGHEIFVIID